MTDIQCGFCSKRAIEASFIVKGPKASICSNCIVECVEIMGGELGARMRALPVAMSGASRASRRFEAICNEVNGRDNGQ